MEGSTQEAMAAMIQTILAVVDAGGTDEGIRCLEEAQELLKQKISRNAAAFPLIVACGGQYDETEDGLKAEEMRCIIELLKIRKELREHVVKQAENRRRDNDVLRLFQITGAM